MLQSGARERIPTSSCSIRRLPLRRLPTGSLRDVLLGVILHRLLSLGRILPRRLRRSRSHADDCFQTRAPATSAAQVVRPLGSQWKHSRLQRLVHFPRSRRSLKMRLEPRRGVISRHPVPPAFPDGVRMSQPSRASSASTFAPTPPLSTSQGRLQSAHDSHFLQKKTLMPRDSNPRLACASPALWLRATRSYG